METELKKGGYRNRNGVRLLSGRGESLLIVLDIQTDVCLVSLLRGMRGCGRVGDPAYRGLWMYTHQADLHLTTGAICYDIWD